VPLWGKSEPAAAFQPAQQKYVLSRKTSCLHNENNHDGINWKKEELFVAQKEFSQQAAPPPTARMERGGTIAPFIIG